MGDWIAIMDGAEMCVIEGDPDETGERYVIRFRTDREVPVPLHHHPQDEQITVLSGPFELGFEGGELRALDAGSNLVVPAGVRHRARYGPGTVVEVSGTGPFKTLY